MNTRRACTAAALLLGTIAATASAQDWSAVALIRHDAYQAVNADGSPAYTGGFPLRLRGVVLNNPEDWLDPTPNFIPTVWPDTAWMMGGEWEIFVQAVDSPDSYDDGDFGGVACWMGQNYGNHFFNQDTTYSYSDAEWTAELARLDYVPALDPADPNVYHVRAGDLIEIRARGGLPYQGKYNVNEMHHNDPATDFEIVMLEKDYGLPEPLPTTLADFKDAGDNAIFDPTRQTGGEHYQATRVILYNVLLDDPNDWAADADLLLVDDTGRSLDVHLGLHPSFDAPNAAADRECHIIGFIDQASYTGVGGYRLMVMHADDFRPACGDANCDGVVNSRDIDDFVAALTAPDAATWEADRPCGYLAANDINGDGEVNSRDIDGFVAALTGGGCP